MRLLACLLLLSSSLLLHADDTAAEKQRLKELDALWNEVSRTVREGDFDGYAETCHPEGVLVSGTKGTSYALTKALARWKQGFLDTKAGKMKANVIFRFGQRYGDATTAHETGMFYYTATDPEGKKTADYIHFEALLVKKKDGWKITMEYQKFKGTKADWDKLKPQS